MNRSRQGLAHIARLMRELAAPTAADVIFDPAGLCHPEANGDLDFEQVHARLCEALSPQHAQERERYSLVLVPAPTTVSIEAKAVAEDLRRGARTRRSDLLCLALCLRMLAPGGRALVLLPEGVLHGTTKAHQGLRRGLIEDRQLEAVIRLPAGALRPRTAAATAILVLAKSGAGAGGVWFYEVEADGYGLDAKRAPLLAEDKLGPVPAAALAPEEHGRNNLPDLLARWRERSGAERERGRSAQSFVVPTADIVAQAYDLSPDSYREPASEPALTRRPQELLAELAGLEAEIFQGIRNLVGLLK